MNDVVRAIDHSPGGRQHFARAANLRHPAGWLRWRLSRRLNLDGTARASPTRAAEGRGQREGRQPGTAPRPRMRATYTRAAGVRDVFAAYDLGEDKCSGTSSRARTRVRFLEFCR